MRRLPLLVLALFVSATACVSVDGKKQGTGPPTTPAAGAEGQFVSRCTFDHRASDDPIVKPSQLGASHSHDFFGNVSTNANSTYDSLRAAPATSCRPGDDKAAYWVPTLYLNDQPIAAGSAGFYYRSGRRDPKTVQPFPGGLKMVAGNAMSLTVQDPWITGWSCAGDNGGPETKESSDVPTCPAGSELHLRVTFPDCWNGADLDSADHKSHMAYSTRGVCPTDHSVAVPALTFSIRYPISGGSAVRLASGTAYTAHGDFFNAWDQSVLTGRVQSCINAAIICDTRGQSRPPA